MTSKTLRQSLSRFWVANAVPIMFVVLIAFARRVAGPVPDPVSHALVLTGIVVTVSATAVALALAVRLHDDEDGRRE